MNFAFSEEQDQLRDAVRRFLDSKSPSSEVRRLMETTEGYDPAVWSQMANELGLQSIHIPEEYGGQGFTFVELAIVLELEHPESDHSQGGPRAAVRAVLLERRARSGRDHERGNRRAEGRAAARHRVG